MFPNYDTIAAMYDRMASLVFGRKLVDAQVYLLQAVPAGASVLIVGGGTGWVLEELARVHPSGLNITYVDASVKMVQQARARNVGENRVMFLAVPVEEIDVAAVYDVALTPFFFDNFTEGDMRILFGRLHEQLRPGGLWLYCDFSNGGSVWQRWLLRVMYVFFMVFCGVLARALPDVGRCYRGYGYDMVKRKEFMGGFVEAVVYERCM